MNRKVIGMYLKQLREQKKLTQEQLASIFSEDYGISISVHAISEWENGNTLPTGENLETLSDIYGKTMDEILDGKDKSCANYNDIYFSVNNNWLLNHHPDSLYHIGKEQHLKIIKRFKQLSIKSMENSLSNDESEELRFLFENFYVLTNYESSYTNFLMIIRKINNEFIDKSIEEKYWELQKQFRKKETLLGNFKRDIGDINNKSDDIIREIFKESELWEKDAILAFFQEKDPLPYKPNSFGSKTLQKYIEENGEYDDDKYYRNCIITLIENGARLNKIFFNVPIVYEKQVEIIHTLEGLYQMYYKPLIVETFNSNGDIEYYQIDNNEKNRFLIEASEYYPSILCELPKAGLDSIDDMFEKFLLCDHISKDIYLKFAELYGINVNREEQFWMADLNSRIKVLMIEREQFRENHKRAIKNKNLFKELKEKLKNGEKYYIDKYEKKSTRTINMDTMVNAKDKLSYKEYLESREEESTKEMLIDLDKLTFDEIRKKYFMKED